jgi:cysteine-rich repeat protein
VTAGETCDDGNAANGDGCDANCRPTGCGNGALSEGEQCDDGNETPADGCGVDCAIDFGAQTPAQRACIAAVGRGLAKIARAQASASLRCLRAAASGSLQPQDARAALDACLADLDDRVASVTERALAKARARCVDGELPELALGADPLAGLVAARDEALGLVRALLGDPSRVVPGDDRPAAACQRKALRGSSQLVDVFARALERGLARALVGTESAPARNDAELSARVEAALADSAPVERAAGRVAASVAAACSALPDLPQALPVCAVAGPDAVGGCVAAQSRCSACALALAGNPTLALSCDRLDDGLANASCAP